MLNPVAVAEEAVVQALVDAFGADFSDVDPVVRPSAFADYQANVALSLARQMRRSPRDIATAIVDKLASPGIARTEVSGPGYINVYLDDNWLSAALSDRRQEVMSIVDPARVSKRVVIDYSSPNVAKEMHVGHLRTTVVGDSIARLREAIGDTVVRQNHIGDWGTPFGMLIEVLVRSEDPRQDLQQVRTDPNTFYKAARARFDQEPEFADAARRRVVLLQSGDPETLELWRTLVSSSVDYFEELYRRLGIRLERVDLDGESTYNDQLPLVCDELETLGLAETSEGALCVFPKGFQGRDGKPLPLIIRKSGGGYGYATTDLATIKHRVTELEATEIIYVVGAPQAQYLQMVFATAQEAGWLSRDVAVAHVQIGNVLGADGKILKTRSGESPKLSDLIDNAVARARSAISAADLDSAEFASVAEVVGTGAVKYADLSVAHNTEYTFDLDRMTALTGNTGPYLQYAGVRLRSLLKDQDGIGEQIRLLEPAERSLGLMLLQYARAVHTAAESNSPHVLAAYLFEAAQRFSAFYDACRIVDPDNTETTSSRLALCRRAFEVIEHGLELLGIAIPSRM